MLDDVTPDEGLEVEEEVLDEPVDDDLGDDDAPVEDSADQAADLLVRLQELERNQQTLASTVEQTLKREVGRIQSLAAKFDAQPTAGNEEALRREIGQLADLVSDAITAIDDTALDPQVKQRVVATRQEAKRAAETASLEDRIKAMIAEATKGSEAEPVSDTRQAAITLEQDIVEGIKDAGLDPADFDDDWTEASTIYSKEGERGVRRFFNQKVATALREEASASRRQARKSSSADTPKTASPAKDDFEKLADATVTEGIELLRNLGIKV